MTPGPRRFVPPPSSTPSSSVPPNPSNRFVRPSQPSSSPFPRTPFSNAARSAAEDEIEAEDLEDADIDLSHDLAPRSQWTQTSQHRKAGDIIHPSSDEDDHLHVEGSRQGRNTILSALSDDAALRTTAKRRKTSHVNRAFDETDTDLINSSSGTPLAADDQGLPNELDEPDQTVQTPEHDIEFEVPSSPTSSDISPVKDFETPKHRSSRFYPSRAPPSRFDAASAQLHQSGTHDLPLPSFQSRLLSSTASPGPHVRGPHPSIDYTLPDAFSPSRRRGGTDYIYGGHAETVRGWVLDVAAQAIGSPYKPLPKSARHDLETGHQRNVAEQEIVTEVLLQSPESDFALVSTIPAGSVSSGSPDKPGLRMLINSTSGPSAHVDPNSGSRLGQLQSGNKIVTKGGGAMGWNLELTHGNDDELYLDQSSVYQVAVLWDIVQ
ncbi:hypothetical protein LTR05_008703 [Lithohypha guttulata]|uniref:Uncharacterized protein n=1 Tax=Lithohypha guttulata TaxID=1690604 RepID=A0AAN7PPY2_9EURO|nr:hypothetical protein LTR05_008703 [Lithohypha guttulata]